MTDEEGRRVKGFKEDGAVRILMESPLFNDERFTLREKKALVDEFCNRHGFKLMGERR